MPSRILDGVLGALSQDMAIDLGTANTLLHVRGRGVVCREPSVVALHTDHRGQKSVLAAGMEAREMLGRAPSDIRVVRPLRDGVISDFEVTEAMLRLFMHRSMGPNHIVRPRTVVCIPYGTTEVEKRAMRECAEAAGAREVHLVEEPLAAAIGAGLDITEPSGNMVVDVGGGTTEVAVVSLGGIVYSRSVRVGGDQMDAAIIEYLKDSRGLLVGPVTAEEIKIKLGNAAATRRDPKLSLEVRGRDLVTGWPRAVRLSSDEVREALAGTVQLLVDTLLAALDKTPPELASDIVDKGIVLTGGAAQLKRMDLAMRQATGLPVIIADDPGAAVVAGAARALGHIDFLRAVAC
ncbi:MAG: rod shape-determining protein [Myxococcota bacterium]|nr:rod shape-determining protein [Myxococcota bacterium]